MDALFFAVAAAYAVAAPYTKVEESFFMQAAHDALAPGLALAQWDHVEFPGAVPRSFVGPLGVAALAWPASLVCSGTALQVAVRLALALAVTVANARLRRAVGAAFGARAAWWYGVLSVAQFHLAFWASRLLANTLALVPMLRSERQRHFRRMAVALAFAAIVLRFDCAVFAAAMVGSQLRSLTRRTLAIVAACAAGFVALTVAVDSALWREPWMWPEARGFWFNVVEGRSAEWGTDPPLHYVTRLLPRLLPAALPLAVAGAAADRRIARLAAPSALAVAVFSANAHKEWRFVLPAVPVANACAAAAVVRLGARRLAAVLCAASAAMALGMAYVSAHNYPGGHALARLHALEPAAHATVHIGTYAAMTGATRFGQTRSGWVYDKTEGLAPGAAFANYTHLLTAAPAAHRAHGFEVMAEQRGYAGIGVDLGRFPPLWIRLEPLVWVMRNTHQPGC
ncbi:Alg9-like mannosyltransferase family-domain-containing protein [Kickxella alabastrina]|uniref:Alg9-like mannosyltransferase family-domain-containing protein n=1 Tax=Kickxella alabastrina TaxID=61397 RepID=UPI0022205326|nr:Alg9-like mannosyltransferase family-domain-containing protein [Kickxella alabastrina]KAI7829173.1 Alg9-like mannosyltransferase family-domain-containing protein [Kickxella alabastrina]